MRLSARASSELTSSILLRICLSFQGSALPAVWIGRTDGRITTHHSEAERKQTLSVVHVLSDPSTVEVCGV